MIVCVLLQDGPAGGDVFHRVPVQRHQPRGRVGRQQAEAGGGRAVRLQVESDTRQGGVVIGLQTSKFVFYHVHNGLLYDSRFTKPRTSIIVV